MSYSHATILRTFVRFHYTIQFLWDYGYDFLSHFTVAPDGTAVLVPTERAMEDLADFFLDGMRGLETKWRQGTPVDGSELGGWAALDMAVIATSAKMARAAWAGRTAVTGAETSVTACRAAGFSERITRYGSRVMAGGGDWDDHPRHTNDPIHSAQVLRMTVYFVIFGAAVRDDGSPSGTLRRRVKGALTAAQGVDMARYMPTGGAGTNGYIEADIIKELLLQAGIPSNAIISEREASDTLDSARRCDALLRAAADAESVTLCTSPYHLPRCIILFRAMGWKVRRAPMPSDRGVLPWWKLLLYSSKEILVLPYDLLLLTLSRILTE